MANLPTTDDAAEAILDIFARRNVRSGEILMLSAVNMEFLEDRRFRADDFKAGVELLASQNKIRVEDTKLRLL